MEYRVWSIGGVMSRGRDAMTSHPPRIRTDTMSSHPYLSRHLPPGAATRHLKRVIRSKGDRKPEGMLRSRAPSPSIRFPHGTPFESGLSLCSTLSTQYSRVCTFAQAAGRFARLHLGQRAVLPLPRYSQTKRAPAGALLISPCPRVPLPTCPLAAQGAALRSSRATRACGVRARASRSRRRRR